MATARTRRKPEVDQWFGAQPDPVFVVEFAVLLPSKDPVADADGVRELLMMVRENLLARPGAIVQIREVRWSGDRPS